MSPQQTNRRGFLASLAALVAFVFGVRPTSTSNTVTKSTRSAVTGMNSGDLHASPIIFDDALITTALLHGEIHDVVVADDPLNVKEWKFCSDWWNKTISSRTRES